jgi:predicted amidohydrolase YtcJ
MSAMMVLLVIFHLMEVLVSSQQYMRIDPKMEVVDLEGKFVTPGFIDSHLHFLYGGLQVCHDSLLYSPVFVHHTG